MTDQILLRGLKFYGHHGVKAEEQALGGRYSLDLTLERELAAAGASDDLADTTSYSAVARAALAAATRQRFRLLESLAEAVAAEVLERFEVDAVVVRVTKEHPPVPELLVGAAAVEILRRRSRPDGPEEKG